MFEPAFLGSVRLGQYSWNQFAQPIGLGPAWTPSPLAPAAAPVGKDDVHCYHCDNPAMFGYLSESQAEQWNEKYNRNCQRSPEKECRDNAARAYGAVIPGLFQRSFSAPQTFSMTGRIPTRPIGLSRF